MQIFEDINTKRVSRFHQIAFNKSPKSKFPGRACPRTPLVCHILCTQIHAHTGPPNNQYNLILPLLGKKLKETLKKMPLSVHL